MAYVGVALGAGDSVGDIVGVMEGEGVRLCVGIGLSVSDGVGGTLIVEVFSGDGRGMLVDVTIAVTASVCL